MEDKARFIQPVIVACIMAFLMTAVITYLNVGMPADFMRRWLVAFVVAWPLATVAAFIAIPVARRLTLRIVGAIEGRRRA